MHSERSSTGVPALHSGQFATGIVLRRGILGQREVRHADVDDRFQPIADLDACAITLPPASSIAAFARANVSPVLRTSSASSTRRPFDHACDRTAAAPACRCASDDSGAKLVGGCVRLRRPSSSPASVCANSAPPITGPATTSVLATIGSGSTLDQILREAPDERRLPENAVRIQVHAAVIAVAVVEVPVEHEHVVFAQIGQRGLAN